MVDLALCALCMQPLLNYERGCSWHHFSLGSRVLRVCGSLVRVILSGWWVVPIFEHPIAGDGIIRWCSQLSARRSFTNQLVVETEDAFLVMTEVFMWTMFDINPIFASPHTWATSMNVREGPASHAFIMCVHLSVAGLQIKISTPCLGGFSPSPNLSPPAPETPSHPKRRLPLLQTFSSMLQTNFWRHC